MPYPYLTNPQILPPGTVHEVDSLIALLNAYLAVQHNADGTHGAITCDSLVASGDIGAQNITAAQNLGVQGGITVHGGIATGGAITTPALTATGAITGGSLASTSTIIATGRITANDAVIAANGVYEHGRGTPMGDWIDVPYAAGDFTASGSMTWTVTAGNIVTRRYALVGHTLFYTCFIQGTTVGGTPSNELHVKLPSPFTVAHHAITGACVTQDIGAGLTNGYTQIVAGQNYLLLTRPGNANFSIGSGTAAYFTAVLEVA